jgi:hypothetical protein
LQSNKHAGESYHGKNDKCVVYRFQPPAVCKPLRTAGQQAHCGPQGDRMKKSGEFVENNISQEAIVKRASETLSFKAELNRCKRFIQVCSNMAKNSKILSTVINPHTAMILIEAHIKTPM